MAKIELNVLQRQGLSDRIGSRAQMKRDTQAWARCRNKDVCRIDWQFTTKDTRIKLKRLYPQYLS